MVLSANNKFVHAVASISCTIAEFGAPSPSAEEHDSLPVWYVGLSSLLAALPDSHNNAVIALYHIITMTTCTDARTRQADTLAGRDIDNHASQNQ